MRGIAGACAQAGTALVGGETAEHPGLLAEDEYDVAGAQQPVWSRQMSCSAPSACVRATSRCYGVLRYSLQRLSLVRKVLNVAGWGLERQVDELGRTIGEELLEPTRVYAADFLIWRQHSRHGEDGTTGSGVRGFT